MSYLTMKENPLDQVIMFEGEQRELAETEKRLKDGVKRMVKEVSGPRKEILACVSYLET